MPRGPRLDLPGLLQHVMVRGIEGRDIFRDDRDRDAFVSRLSALLEEAHADLLAWALLSNHLHLLIRPRQSTLATLMRRLLTGYAVTFNLRHHRSGHLYQNRYKSIVCDEEEYLLELVRYIHLNPVRAGLVGTIAELDRYPWSGHAVLLGNRELPGQAADEVLERFGRRQGAARDAYRAFVEAGIADGRRKELTGGGLRRSLEARGEELGRGREASDERILGTGEFVEQLWQREELRDRVSPRVPIEAVIDAAARAFGVEAEELRWRSKRRPVAEARAVVCYLAVRELGWKGTVVGKMLGLSPAGVSLAVRRGLSLAETKPGLRRQLGMET